MLKRPIRTKIVCTLGTGSGRDSMAAVARLIQAGMDVARVNMSHSRSFAQHGAYVRGDSYEADRWRLNAIRDASASIGHPVAILGDLQGPKIRLGEFADGEVTLVAGQRFTFWADPEHPGDAKGVPLQDFALIQPAVAPLTPIWLVDGLVQLTVSRSEPDRIEARVDTGGVIGSRQGIIFRGVDPPLPQMTPKDIADLAFLCDQQVDFIALSYVRKPDDVLAVRALMGDQRIPLIGKIETAEAVTNLDALLSVLDGAMVARGDLGARLPLEEVPLVQKSIIERCNVLGIPVITATQMLDSMETRPIPTRAEVTDIANAVLDGTDALMLSGETAKGSFAVESIQTLVSVARRIEGAAGPFHTENPRADDHPWEGVVRTHAYRLNYKERNFKLEAAIQRLRQAGAYPVSTDRQVSDALSRAAADVAEQLGLHCILCPTTSGMTPRLVARFRPSAQIIGAVEDPARARQLLLSYGITPLVVEASPDATAEDLLRAAQHTALRAGLLQAGERFLFTAGYPIRQAGSTNLLKVHVAASADAAPATP